MEFGEDFSDENFLGDKGFLELNRKIDSVIEWIGQFHERFLYLDSEVMAMKEKEAENRREINRLIRRGGGEREVFLKINDVESELAVLSRKIDMSRAYFEEKVAELDLRNSKSEVVDSRLQANGRDEDKVEVKRKYKKLVDTVKEFEAEIKKDKARVSDFEVGSKEWLREVRRGG